MNNNFNQQPFMPPQLPPDYEDQLFQEMQNDSNNYNNNHDSKKKFPIYNSTIFKFPNPRSGVITLEIDPWSGNLYITLAPAIPNNPGIGAKGNIPKGAKCFDYSKKASTILMNQDVQNIIDFLKPKIYGKNNSGNSNTNILKEVMSIESAIAAQDISLLQKTLSELKAKAMISNNSNVSISDEENFEIAPLYRKSQNGPNKVWNINFEENKKTLYVRCTVGGDKNSAVYMGISKKMLILFYSALKSYINSYASLMVTSSILNALK